MSVRRCDPALRRVEVHRKQVHTCSQARSLAATINVADTWCTVESSFDRPQIRLHVETHLLAVQEQQLHHTSAGERHARQPCYSRQTVVLCSFLVSRK